MLHWGQATMFKALAALYERLVPGKKAAPAPAPVSRGTAAVGGPGAH